MGALAGDLDGLMNPLALTNLIEWLLISMCLESLEVKYRENMSVKLAYLTEIFGGAFLAIKLAFWYLQDKWTPLLYSGYSGWLRIFKPTAILVDLLLLGFVTKFTAYW